MNTMYELYSLIYEVAMFLIAFIRKTYDCCKTNSEEVRKIKNLIRYTKNKPDVDFDILYLNKISKDTYIVVIDREITNVDTICDIFGNKYLVIFDDVLNYYEDKSTPISLIIRNIYSIYNTFLNDININKYGYYKYKEYILCMMMYITFNIVKKSVDDDECYHEESESRYEKIYSCMFPIDYGIANIAEVDCTKIYDIVKFCYNSVSSEDIDDKLKYIFEQNYLKYIVDKFNDGSIKIEDNVVKIL